MQIVKNEILDNGIRYTMGMPEGVCSQIMEVFHKDGIVLKVRITGGCDGNTTGVSRLVEGMPIKQVIARIKGIDCHGNGTSCPDRLAQLLETIAE